MTRNVVNFAWIAVALPFMALPQDPPIPRITPITVNGFLVELKQCQKLSTKAINCEFAITNQMADRRLRIFAPGTYFVDAGGFEIQGKAAVLGSQQGRDIATESVTDVPIRGSVEFPVGDPRATSIAKLSLGFLAPKEFRVEFRRIALE